MRVELLGYDENGRSRRLLVLRKRDHGSLPPCDKIHLVLRSSDGYKQYGDIHLTLEDAHTLARALLEVVS